MILHLFLREDVPPEHRLRTGRPAPSTTDHSSSTASVSVPLPSSKSAQTSKPSHVVRQSNAKNLPLISNSAVARVCRPSQSPTPYASTNVSLHDNSPRLTRSLSPTGSNTSSTTVVLSNSS